MSAINSPLARGAISAGGHHRRTNAAPTNLCRRNAKNPLIDGLRLEGSLAIITVRDDNLIVRLKGGASKRERKKKKKKKKKEMT
ncbi:unnamed protein product [Heligmosomoides polygyrus]|uniref:Uncharacterized protein n=1 Tax=Heligmosomoides polygyrus TaxID=6339 RepID=A0A3P7Z3L7_HELPZ|nr:unnamed protein product [Heligmosomoides polygyrus]